MPPLHLEKILSCKKGTDAGDLNIDLGDKVIQISYVQFHIYLNVQVQ